MKINVLKIRNLFILISLSSFALDALSQNPQNYPFDKKPHLRLDLPLMDFGHWKNAAQTGANLGCSNPNCKTHLSDWAGSIIKNPSMYQSSAWNMNVISSVAYGTQILTNKVIKPKRFVGKVLNIIVSQGITGAVHLNTNRLPIGSSWLHEEYHRAVMATNQVASSDPFADFKVDEGGTGSVSNELDSELARFKKNDPYSFNRMLIAGSEGELLAAKKLYENNFFNNANLPTELVSLLHILQTNQYFDGDPSRINEITKTINTSDGADISKRDFTGYDYSGWLWHLFKPTVPYDSLGIHPSGVGINRYISYDRLTFQETRYYENVKSKVTLNFLNPMLFGFRRIRIKNGVYMNFATTYQPTSFGTSTNLMLYYLTEKTKASIGLHKYKNYQKSYYAVETNLLSLKPRNSNKMTFDSRLIIGVQPKNQEFFTTKSQPFLLASLTGFYRLNKSMSAYVQVQGKTKGWVAGDEYLKSMFRARAGASFHF